MTSVLVIADSGRALAELTAAVQTVSGTYIARHASGCRSLDRIVSALSPDVVVIGELASGRDALDRLAEIRRSAPAAKVVLLSSRTDADWLADALRAHASAVLPGAVEAQTLGAVLREVIAEPRLAAVSPVPFSRRAVYRSTSHEGKAA